MKFKIGFDLIKNVFHGAKNLPKIIGMAQDAIKYLKLIDAIKAGLKQPAANLFFQARKELEKLKQMAAQTDLNGDGDKLNDIDDIIFEKAISAVDSVMDFFHLTDDYEKLVQLDKAAEIK